MKLLLVLCLGLVGCHAATPMIVYRPTIPQFQARPLSYSCVIVYATGEERTTVCLKVLMEDVLAIVAELRQTCMALGWPESECQVSFRPRIGPMPKPEEQLGVPGTGA